MSGLRKMLKRRKRRLERQPGNVYFATSRRVNWDYLQTCLPLQLCLTWKRKIVASFPRSIFSYSTQSFLARPSKRKLDFDSSTVEALAREAEEAALRQIEREQAESLRHKLPDFWLPSLTPTYTSSGLPNSFKDVKIQTTCRGGNPPHPISLVINLSYRPFLRRFFLG